MTPDPGGAPTLPLDLQPISANVSLRDRAYAALKQAIVEADIYAHTREVRLDERKLSDQLGVSRTPIREAMTLLEQESSRRANLIRGARRTPCTPQRPRGEVQRRNWPSGSVISVCPGHAR